MRKSKIVSALLLAVLALTCVTVGCSNWERQTYNSLAASKAVIDQAAKDFNAGALPQSAQVKLAIENAQKVQAAAVNAFWGYEQAKIAKSGDLAAKQKAVVDALARVPEVLALIQSFYKTGGK